jgi:hypothetical protein
MKSLGECALGRRIRGKEVRMINVRACVSDKEDILTIRRLPRLSAGLSNSAVTLCGARAVRSKVRQGGSGNVLGHVGSKSAVRPRVRGLVSGSRRAQWGYEAAARAACLQVGGDDRDRGARDQGPVLHAIAQAAPRLLTGTAGGQRARRGKRWRRRTSPSSLMMFRLLAVRSTEMTPT